MVYFILNSNNKLNLFYIHIRMYMSIGTCTFSKLYLYFILKRYNLYHTYTIKRETFTFYSLDLFVCTYYVRKHYKCIVS